MESISFLSIVLSGGWLMIPIVICSIIVVAVAIERYLAYKKLKINIPQLIMSIRHPLNAGNVLDAINECTVAKGPVAAVIKAGLQKVKSGRESVKEAMETAGNAEVYHLEKNLSVLATLAGITPLIGFLGTVTGMIKAFMKIQQLSGNVNADVLAGGIWEAMVTTAAGLTVGIPAMILYNYYVNRVREFTFHMESTADEVLDMIVNVTEKANDVSPEKKPEVPTYNPPQPMSPAPAKPPVQNTPPAQTPPPERTVPPESPSRIELAEENFDPEDKNFDGGITS
ncbi:MotA/TolQ/ExbB proton channel family protein [Candidatus Latescibacterota bacterium]